MRRGRIANRGLNRREGLSATAAFARDSLQRGPAPRPIPYRPGAGAPSPNHPYDPLGHLVGGALAVRDPGYGGRRQPRNSRDGNWSRSSSHARQCPRERQLERTNGPTEGSRPQKAGPAEAKGLGGKNDCGLKSLRKEVVFAVKSCIRKRRDGGGRSGVARPERCGGGR